MKKTRKRRRTNARVASLAGRQLRNPFETNNFVGSLIVSK